MSIGRPDRAARPNMVDYEAERARFELTVPERFNYVTDVLDVRARDTPDELALLSLGADGVLAERHTFGQLARDVRRAANAFEALGLGHGDVVFVMLPRIAAWYITVLGAIRVGAIPAPATPQLTSRDVAYRVTQAGATAAVVDMEAAAKIDAVRGELPFLRTTVAVGEAPNSGWKHFENMLDQSTDHAGPLDPTASADPMLLYFTSGTVAHPKMVVHTHASYGLGHTITARYWQDLRPGDLHWTISDTGWAKAAWGKLFGQWAVGAAVAHMNMGKPDPDLILDTIDRHGVTTFCAPPTLYRLLVQADLHGHDLSRLRHCVSAGEPLNPEVIRIWEEGTQGLTIFDGYGQTETVNLVANYRCLPVRPGSMGKPTPGFDIAIVDDDGSPLPDGEEGNIAVRTAPERPVGLCQGYLNDPAATAEAFRGGWYFTGDRAHRDTDGYLWFHGRADDVITSAAYRIGPFEVESALVEHPLVVEAAVVGRPDVTRTEIVTAFVIVAPGVDRTEELKAELQAHVRQATAPYKRPREIHFVDELPKTVSGKIRRSELRQRLRSWG